MMNFDVDKLALYAEKGLISRQKHPTEELYIYNYSNKCQYESCWDDVTLACRGLILDADGNIVARPFPKFFNLSEMSRSDITFSKPFQIFDKLDGSLGIMYRIPDTDKISIATRGSFASDQAIKATEIYKKKYFEYQPAAGTTPLFEIIYSSNRIVVDYGDMEDIILLTVIDNKTGRDVPDAFWFGPKVKSYHFGRGDELTRPQDTLARLELKDDGNTEGVVLLFDHPKEGPKTRVKLKLDEYVRLHKILTNVSTTAIWETLRDGNSINEILDKVPDEFFKWVTNTVAELTEEFKWTRQRIIDVFELKVAALCVELGNSTLNDLDECKQFCRGHRKDFAESIKNHQYMSYLFALLDDRDISYAVWNMCKPEFSKAFTSDNESLLNV